MGTGPIVLIYKLKIKNNLYIMIKIRHNQKDSYLIKYI